MTKFNTLLKAVLLALICFSSIDLPAQIYQNDYTYSNPTLFQLRSTKHMEEVPGTGELVVVNSVAENTTGGTPFDILVTVLRADGAVSFTRRFGRPGENEVVDAMCLSPDGRQVLITGYRIFGSGLSMHVRAFVLRADLSPGGGTWFYNYYDGWGSPLANDRLLGIIPTFDGRDDYLVYGWSQLLSPANQKPKLWIMRIDRLGNIVSGGVYSEPASSGQDGSMTAVQADYNAAGNLMITGTYLQFISGSPQNDIFAIEVDKFANPVSQLHYYDVSDGSGSGFTSNTNSWIECGAGGNYALAFDSYQLWPGLATNGYVTVMEIDPGFNPVWVNSIWSDQLNTFPTGIVEDAGNGYWIGATESNLSPNTTNLSAIHIDPAGNLSGPGYVRYTPNYYPSGGGQDMHASPDFIYHSDRFNGSNTLKVVKTDYTGFVGLGCHDFPVISEATPIPVHQKVDLKVAQEMVQTSHEPFIYNISGSYTGCGGASGTFKKPSETQTSASLSEMEVFPTVLNAGQTFTVRFPEPLNTQRAYSLLDAQGRVLLKGTFSPNSAEFTLNTRSLAAGLNILKVEGETAVRLLKLE